MDDMMPALNIIFLVIASVLSIAAVVSFYCRDYAEARTGARFAVPRDAAGLDPKAYRVLLIIIIAVGVGIRLWQFGSVPGGMNQDGAMAAVDGKALADYATDRYGTLMPAHLYAWGYGQMSSLLSYMIAPFVKLFGLNPITARLPSLLMSLLGGVFLYLFVRDTFGRRAALFAAMIVAVNPWHFLQSRWALDCNLLPHFFMGGIYFFGKGLNAKKRWLFLSMIFFGLCMYCYGITIYTIPVFLLATSVFYLIKKRLKLSHVLICAGVYLAVAWPFILTMMINFFQWETVSLPFVTCQYFPDSTRTSDILFFSGNIRWQLEQNLQYFLNVTLLQLKDAPQNDIEHYYTMYRFMIPFVLAGIAVFPKIQSNGTKSLAVFALLTGVWVGVFTNFVNVNRIAIIYYAMMIFASLGVWTVAVEIKRAGYAAAVMTAVGALLMTGAYFTTYNQAISRQFYDGFGDAIKAAAESPADILYITADVQGEGFWTVSEILTLFYDETDAAYYQGVTDINHHTKYLPYRERFRYESICDETVAKSKDENAAYVVLRDDLKFFDLSDYSVLEFGDYITLTKG
jgi:hypothetical protein